MAVHPSMIPDKLSSKDRAELIAQHGHQYPLIERLARHGHPLTREAYINASYGNEMPEEWDGENEMELPPPFRRSSP